MVAVDVFNGWGPRYPPSYSAHMAKKNDLPSGISILHEDTFRFFSKRCENRFVPVHRMDHGPLTGLKNDFRLSLSPQAASGTAILGKIRRSVLMILTQMKIEPGRGAIKLPVPRRNTSVDHFRCIAVISEAAVSLAPDAPSIRMDFASAAPAAAACSISGVFGAARFRALKTHMLNSTIPALPAIEHQVFADVFGGMQHGLCGRTPIDPAAYRSKRRVDRGGGIEEEFMDCFEHMVMHAFERAQMLSLSIWITDPGTLMRYGIKTAFRCIGKIFQKFLPAIFNCSHPVQNPDDDAERLVDAADMHTLVAKPFQDDTQPGSPFNGCGSARFRILPFPDYLFQ